MKNINLFDLLPLPILSDDVQGWIFRSNSHLLDKDRR